jgi:hypothetical protein
MLKFKYRGTKTKCQHRIYDASESLINTSSSTSLMTWHYASITIYLYIYILLKEKAFCVSIRLKKTYLLKLDLTLFQIYDASESQFKFDSTPTTHISLCPHLKKLLVVSHKMNRTSTCRSHRRMTSIMFKFRQTDRQKKREWTTNCKCMLQQPTNKKKTYITAECRALA